jgi:hypothetical protein
MYTYGAAARCSINVEDQRTALRRDGATALPRCRCRAARDFPPARSSQLAASRFLLKYRICLAFSGSFRNISIAASMRLVTSRTFNDPLGSSAAGGEGQGHFDVPRKGAE